MKAEELKQHAIDFVMWYDESKPDGRFAYKIIYHQWLKEQEEQNGN